MILHPYLQDCALRLNFSVHGKFNFLYDLTGWEDIFDINEIPHLYLSIIQSSLRENIDNGNISTAYEIAIKSITNDVIIALLAMVQCVDRNVNDDFRPINHSDNNNNNDLNNMADVALLTLTDLYSVGETYLRLHDVDISTYLEEEEEDHHPSDYEDYDGKKWNCWQLKLIMSIPMLIEPGCINGHVVWAATIVYYQHGTTVEDQFDLECSPQSSSDGAIKDHDSSHDVISVIDVLKSDEEGNSSCLRGTYYGCWHGLYAEAVGEIDMNNSIGSVLESWTDTTLAGLSVTKTKQSSLSDENIFESVHILVIGLACGNLVTFLQKHIENVELYIVEESQRKVDIAVKYYQVPTSVLDCISIVDPIEYVKSCQEEEDQVGNTFDTIIVNVCSSEDTFPTTLMNGDFFSGLICMLSNHPTATLLVNCGVSVDDVSLLVDDACKNMCGHRPGGHMLTFREHLLRDHVVSSNDEGIIVAARKRGWTLSVDSWNQEHLGDNVEASGSMDVANAQQTQVVRLEQFLTKEEIELIHTVANAELANIGDEAAGSALEAHTDSWKVLYLQSNSVFQRKLPTIRQKILDTIRQVERDQSWCLFDNVDRVNIRVVEYHTNQENHSLSDPRHYDLNSLLTCDIMLSEDGSFEGGHLQTLEADGKLKKHEFKQGDALIFVSHKYHNVSRVISGRRNVMVLEFWYGPERQCPHRCEKFGGQICNRDPGQDSYTQQYHSSKQSNHLKEHSNPSLPFRLGSVSSCKGNSRETFELLWEPSEIADTSIDKPASEEQVRDKPPSDAFACFGDDSDSDDNEVVTTNTRTSTNEVQISDKPPSDPFACFGSDSDDDQSC